MTWVVVLRTGHAIHVSDAAGEAISDRVSGEVPSKPTLMITDLEGNKAPQRLDAISGCYPEVMYEAMVREKRGETKCLAGYWHKFGDKCAHKVDPPGAKAVPVAPDAHRDPDEPRQPANPEQLEIIQRNLTALKLTGKIGTEGLSPQQVREIEERAAAKRAKAAEYRKRPAIADPQVRERHDALLAAEERVSARVNISQPVTADEPEREYQGD